MKQAFSLGIIFCLINSCTSNNQKQPVANSIAKQVEKSFSISSIGLVEFVRSFSFLQSSTMSQKEIDKLYNKTEKSNPLFTDYKGDTTDNILKKYLERSGFVQGDEFLISKFKYSKKPDTSLTNSNGERINIYVYSDTVGWGDHDKITIYNSPDSASAKATIYAGVKYVLLDVIPGGNKELVLLNEHYLMNTEFYYLEVFEIKSKD